MYDRELVIEIASQIHKATQTIMRRFEVIQTPGDFTDSEAGMEKLDGICMQLITIGEGLKNLDKVTGRSLLPRYRTNSGDMLLNFHHCGKQGLAIHR